MTLKRWVLGALAGVVLSVGVAQAAWFYQSGRWYYTPDIGSEVTFTDVTGSRANVVWNLTTTRYAFACRNPAGNEASETVMVQEVQLGSTAQVAGAKKKKRDLTLSTDISTDSLAGPEASIYCINLNWHPDPDSVLVYEFTATITAYSCQGTDSDCSTVEASQAFSCVLSDQSYTPLNLPPAETPYNCQ